MSAGTRIPGSRSPEPRSPEPRGPRPGDADAAARELPAQRGAAVGRVLSGALVRGGWRVRVLGEWRVPTQGPVILAANHSNFLDGPLLLGVSPRPVHFLVKQEFFRWPLGPLLRGVGQIPIDREGADRRAITSAVSVLEQGGAVGVFPEGTRLSGGAFAQVRNGLTYLALRADAPVVPVAVFGTNGRGTSVNALPAPRARIDVVFGDAFRVGDGTGRRTRTVLREAAETVKERLTGHLESSRELVGGDRT